MRASPAMRQAECLTAKRREEGAGGWVSADGCRHLVCVGRPACGGAHNAANTASPHDTASTMSECEQAPRHGKAERHNGEKPRDAASGKANGEEAIGASRGPDVVQTADTS
jgi:hypothetical protein